MNITIRNLDPRTYRSLRARAALAGQTMEQAVIEAIRAWLARPRPRDRTMSLRDLIPEPYPVGVNG